jgi:hypothetical protein
MQRPFVFGIGLSRTGTYSLTEALNVLGWSSVHFPHDERTFVQLRTGDLRLDILRDHDSVTDTPVVPYYRQLDDLFPDSRFVLTVRDPADWLEAAERFWYNDRADQLHDPFHQFINTAVYGVWTFERKRFQDVYERHLRDVREYFRDRPEKLLVLDIRGGEGWDPLCEFLDSPAPDRPFPHRNTSPVA